MKKHEAPAIDWKALYQRLDTARKALDEAIAPSAAADALTLKARSQRVAFAPAVRDTGRPSTRVLKFWLAPEHYAVPCTMVVEVAALREYAVVPHAPGFIIGVTYLHGRMISIVDLRRFFGLPAPGITDLNRVIVLTDGTYEVGFLADRVVGVEDIFMEEIGDPLPANGSRATFARGIASGGVIVLDVLRLLSPEGLVRKAGPNAARAVEEAR